ncbi:SDR family oxidoreductase [Georgenia muralis]|uniref:NAD(P)-dependent dehydrogenase (Short-subunit alcohol dehydrogenase family) n=1 Tax=Georgenia muralis TaxID=154117 RepID=A0A3N4Z4U3_9MICO|nr:SDR family NAD(P)-dependent oxidoreductase [Georgenia muralis]RPF28339.1 NAD(P)-dependent dehydrogenase (short-subunit alcohol dehydrogenase family) [Georgenia muralis]
MRLDGKVALVTGAGSGIGRASALALAGAGAAVVVLGHRKEHADDVLAEIERAGGTGMAVGGDVADEAGMAGIVDQVDERFGRLDVVLANAGINGVWAPLEELTVDEWRTTIDTNLTGTFITVKYAAPLLRRQGGSVVITSSINGTRTFSNTGASAYSSSKAGQVAFAKMVAVELAQDRVRVNVICPGAIETEIDDNTEQRDLDDVQVPVEYPEGQIPLTHGRPGSAQQVADLVLFLASDASAHITGTEVWIDGGQSLLV